MMVFNFLGFTLHQKSLVAELSRTVPESLQSCREC